MNIYQISTTAYEEEDFYLLTSLTESQIVKVIKPIVKAERDDDSDVEFYDNDSLVVALERAYPTAQVFMYQEFDKIII